MILTEVHSVPPTMKFSIQLCKHYTISCSKRFTQIIRMQLNGILKLRALLKVLELLVTTLLMN